MDAIISYDEELQWDGGVFDQLNYAELFVDQSFAQLENRIKDLAGQKMADHFYTLGYPCGMKKDEFLYIGCPVMLCILTKEYELARQLLQNGYFDMQYSLFTGVSRYGDSYRGNRNKDIVDIYQILLTDESMPEDLQQFLWEQIMQIQDDRIWGRLKVRSAFICNPLYFANPVHLFRQVSRRAPYLLGLLPEAEAKEEETCPFGFFRDDITVKEYLALYYLILHFFRKEQGSVNLILSSMRTEIYRAGYHTQDQDEWLVDYQYWLVFFEKLMPQLLGEVLWTAKLKLLELGETYSVYAGLQTEKKKKWQQHRKRHIALFEQYVCEEEFTALLQSYLQQSLGERQKYVAQRFWTDMEDSGWKFWTTQTGEPVMCYSRDPLLVISRFMQKMPPVSRRDPAIQGILEYAFHPIVDKRFLESEDDADCTILQSRIHFLENLKGFIREDEEDPCPEETKEWYGKLFDTILDIASEELLYVAIEKNLIQKEQIAQYLKKAAKKGQYYAIPVLCAYAHEAQQP